MSWATIPQTLSVIIMIDILGTWKNNEKAYKAIY